MMNDLLNYRSSWLSHALTLLLLFAAGCLLASSLGCTQNLPEGGTGNDEHQYVDGDDHDHGSHAGHDHDGTSHAAPHGGHLIELGRDHEYHAELVDDHKQGMTRVYLLDGAMKPLSHDQPLTIVVTAKQETKSFSFDVQDAAQGEFVCHDAELLKLLDSAGATGKLRTTIDDKPYSGSFSHDHHDHGHHHGHDPDSK